MNQNTFGKVAVLMGGISAERDVSLKSGMAVLAALEQSGIDAHAVDAGRDLLSIMTREKFDRAFIALHGRWGEDGVVQGALEMLGIPYTGSGVLASALGMDKLRCKRLWSASGVLTPEYIEIENEDDMRAAGDWLGFPLFVKPAREGSSLGMSKVKSKSEMSAACNKARSHDNRVFAERCVAGPEYTVTVLQQETLPAICVEPSGEYYDFDAKYLRDDTRYHCPCGLDAEAESVLANIAGEAFRAVGCEGWGRVDFMVDESGTPYVLEVNTVPGLTDHSLVPMAARAAGISFEELVIKILETSDAARH